MKHFLLAVWLSATALPVIAADVGVSVSIGQPGFYGQIDIGNYPRPVYYNPRPVVIEHVVVVVDEPVYLRVPPGHRKHWAQHCYEYGACARPVYFVQDNWYNTVYVPQWREHHHGDWDDHDRGDHDDDHHEHHGHGKGHHKHHDDD